MRELSLFSGAGGGLLGSKLLGWQTIGYVEWNDYCQRVIRQRIADGMLENAPLFGDIRAFNSEGYAASYKGMVDVITAGFPCQPYSVAGKRKGADDDRNMWPETIRTIRTVRPRYVLLENVPGILTSNYYEQICGDIVSSGYDCRWRILSAAEVGAPHKRDRLWVLAYPKKIDDREYTPEPLQRQIQQLRECIVKADVPDSERGGLERPKEGIRPKGEMSIKKKPVDICKALPNSYSPGLEKQHTATESKKPGLHCRDAHSEWGNGWWKFEPELGRVAYGVANRMDRLEAIGNGQVPAVVRSAWNLLRAE